MSSRWALLTSIALSLASVPLVVSTAHADDIKLEQVPKAARDTIMAQSAGDKITKVEQKSEGGATVYEATVEKAKGGKYDIKVDAAGKLLKKD
jgi:uncharacterized membrane protein YkoI